MMENPATWGEAERVVQNALSQAAVNRERGVYGPSTARLITDALRAAGLLSAEKPDDLDDYLSEQMQDPAFAKAFQEAAEKPDSEVGYPPPIARMLSTTPVVRPAEKPDFDVAVPTGRSEYTEAFTEAAKRVKVSLPRLRLDEPNVWVDGELLTERQAWAKIDKPTEPDSEKPEVP